MVIAGLQKLSLLDYPNTLACTVFLQGCNLRCPFCHNPSLVTEECQAQITLLELGEFLKARRGILEGVCVSGGEPLMQDDIAMLLEFIKDLGYKIKLDTNGCFPERLKNVIDGGLVDYIAMDIKASAENYAHATGVEIHPDIIDKSIKIIIDSGLEYEFRTTAVKGIHNINDFQEISRRIKGANKYFIQQFVDSGNLIGGAECHPFSKEETEGFLAIAKKQIPETEIRGI